jgi:DNA-binding NarL/FixJ family response regulator
VAEGLSNKQIALKLDLHEKTVKHHVSSVLAKLQANNRTEAAMMYRDASDLG